MGIIRTLVDLNIYIYICLHICTPCLYVRDKAHLTELTKFGVWFTFTWKLVFWWFSLLIHIPEALSALHNMATSLQKFICLDPAVRGKIARSIFLNSAVILCEYRHSGKNFYRLFYLLYLYIGEKRPAKLID